MGRTYIGLQSLHLEESPDVSGRHGGVFRCSDPRMYVLLACAQAILPSTGADLFTLWNRVGNQRATMRQLIFTGNFAVVPYLASANIYAVGS